MLAPAPSFVDVGPVLQQQLHDRGGHVGRGAGAAQRRALVIVQHVDVHAQLQELLHHLHCPEVDGSGQQSGFLGVGPSLQQLLSDDDGREMAGLQLAGLILAGGCCCCLRSAVPEKPQLCRLTGHLPMRQIQAELHVHSLKQQIPLEHKVC